MPSYSVAGVGGVAREARRLPALGVEQVECHVERHHHLRRRGEAKAARAAAQHLGVDVREVERPASGRTGRLRSACRCAPRRSARPGSPSRHLLVVNTTASSSGWAATVERQRAEGGDGVNDQPPPGGAHHSADGGRVVDHAGTGFAVDQADMADGRVGGECCGHGGGVARLGLRHRHHDRLAPGFACEADHAIGIGAGRRDQHAARRAARSCAAPPR